MSRIEKRKGRSKVWIIILIIVAVIVVGSVGGILVDAPGRREIGELSFTSIDLKNLRNGTYIGEYKGTKSHFRDTKVEVIISKGDISNIKILKGAVDKEGKPVILKGGQSMENVFDNVIKFQTLQVDVISGATLTSKTHLKALENALEQAQRFD
ncbi:FMN-binding protein [Clostridium sp. BNL1100]|uniref:FMN-binding protein n=1 Tax=Clostridium sp. BNL1100 TaxID=755731 RepID=UPI00024A79AF|nr:FMN-binding protein [Clostridium sp. BNL1100]AEY67886.1 hypothetical protein Clo1100_3771 [Clostridium sp. BNL1100]